MTSSSKGNGGLVPDHAPTERTMDNSSGAHVGTAPGMRDAGGGSVERAPSRSMAGRWGVPARCPWSAGGPPADNLLPELIGSREGGT